MFAGLSQADTKPLSVPSGIACTDSAAAQMSSRQNFLMVFCLNQELQLLGMRGLRLSLCHCLLCAPCLPVGIVFGSAGAEHDFYYLADWRWRWSVASAKWVEKVIYKSGEQRRQRPYKKQHTMNTQPQAKENTAQPCTVVAESHLIRHNVFSAQISKFTGVSTMRIKGSVHTCWA